MSDDASTTATGSDTATGAATATGPDTAATPDAASGAQEVLAAARAAKDAQPALVRLTRHDKDALLTAMADALVADAATIVAANAEDLERADAAGMDPALRDRLALDADRVAAIAQQLRDAAALPDPVGEVVRGGVLANGLELRQVRVPLGVVGMIYEARPNVTVDAAGLALKSGNAVVLRGGSAAISSNTALIACLRGVLAQRGLPEDLIVGIDRWGREGADVLMRARGLVDVLIPRGGAGLIRRVVENSIVPVIETGTGNTHILIDATADLDQALEIIANAKTQRIGVCNALETLLVHEAAAVEALPRVAARLAESGVTLHADEQAREILAQAGTTASVVPATEEDWDTEYLSLDLAVRVVPDVEAAIAHIRAHSSEHTESILTRDIASQRAFLAGVDSAVVMVNASTRFSDGGEFGFGAEIGISTQKLHARGPMGLPELTTTTWHVIGDGHVRP